MDLKTLSQRAMVVRHQYAEVERVRYGRVWTREDIALGFIGDVGDLAKLVMAQQGLRHIPEAEAKLAHELADCFWSVLVLAEMYQIDLEQAFLKTMDELELSLAAQQTADSGNQG